MADARTTLSIVLIAALCLCNCVFSAENPVSITFLDIEAGKAAIADESLDSYFGQLQPMEMSAKTGSPITGQTLEEQRAECRKRYQAQVRQFTDDERDVFRACTEKVDAALRDKFPRFAEMPWSFLKVSNKIEGGLPHTQDKHIVLSEGTCAGVARRYKSAPERTVSSIAGLLIHEQMHVFQRMNPDLFDSLYTEIWGFSKAEEIASHPWLQEHHLVNPDGPDCSWVFPIGEGTERSFILPLVVFAEGEGLKRMPHDFRMIALELIESDGRFRPKLGEDGKPLHQNLLEVAEYRQAFPSTSNIYHPNEACASMFTTLAMVEFRKSQSNTARSDRQRSSKVPEPVQRWFERNLGASPGRANQGQVR